MSKYQYYGHDDGLVITQPESGKFVEVPMTEAELLAREAAHEIAGRIYEMANFAGVCYYTMWKIIAEAFKPLEAEIARLNMEMVAYRQKVTPKDVEAMTAVIEALQSAKDARTTSAKPV
jgi:hypothetical protein